MSKMKPNPGARLKKKAEFSLVRSPADYVPFVAACGVGGVEAVYADENVWLTRKVMARLNEVEVRSISYRQNNVFVDHELEEKSEIQIFRITAADCKTYDTRHHNLSAIIPVQLLFAMQLSRSKRVG